MEIDFDDLFYAAREAQIMWKKRRQHAQGKINIHVGDEGFTYTVEECNEQIKRFANVERWIYNQLPEKGRLYDEGAEYVVDSMRLRYEPH